MSDNISKPNIDVHHSQIKDLLGAVFGNGREGIKIKVIKLQIQMYFLLALNISIFSMLIKLIFFKGVGN